MRHLNVRRSFVLAGVVCASLLANPALVAAQSDPDDDGRGFPGRDWPLVGGDWTSARYSTLDDINRQTVQTLGAAWVTRFNRGASTRATPVVKDGRMFISAGPQVYAIDGKTGETLWTWPSDEPPTGPSRPFASIAGEALPSRPGVALGGGRVFVGLLDGSVAALSQDTGSASSQRSTAGPTGWSGGGRCQ